MVIIFWKTTGQGSEEIARVELVTGELKGPQAYVDLLTEGKSNLSLAMREAPGRFNGSYLRAEYVP